MTPVPNKAISNAVLLNCLVAPDSCNWSIIFCSIFFAAIIAGLNVTAVGVLPTPSFKLSMPSNFSCKGPRLSRKLFSVAPLGSSIPSPENP